MSEAVTRRLTGLLKFQSQLTLFLRFLFAWGGGRRWAKFPLPGTPFPPFFTWRTPTRPSRPISSGISSRKPFLISQAVDPCCSVLSCILLFPFSVSATSLQPVVVTFRVCRPSADCELLGGRERCCVPACPLCCSHLTLRGCACLCRMLLSVLTR